MKKFFYVLVFVGFLITCSFSACTEKDPTIGTIGNAGVLQAVNLSTGEVFQKEMYGAEIGKIRDTLNVEFKSTMYVHNGDIIEFSYIPNATCREFDLKPLLLVVDTVVNLEHALAYKYEHEMSNLKKGDRGKVFLLIREVINEDNYVQITSVADFAVELP